MTFRAFGVLGATLLVVQAWPAAAQSPPARLSNPAAAQNPVPGAPPASPVAMPNVGQRPPNGVLTLRHALQQAVNSNPRLHAADRNIGMAEGRRHQANKLPNPTIGLEVDNFAPSNSENVGGVETTLMLSQLIELGGKRDARVAAALGDYDSMRWEREAMRLELLSETTLAFVEAVAVQRRIQILDRHVAALEKLVPLMQRRSEAGASSPAEVTRTQVAVGMTRMERERGRLALAVARRNLASLMGQDTPDFTSVAGDFGRIVRPASLDVLVKAVDDNPQLMRWTAIRAQRDGELLVARLKPIPDVTASVGWRYYSDNGESAIRLGASMPFPVFDRNRGGIREAQENSQKVHAERAANRFALIAVVAKAHDTAASQLQQLDLVRRSILPAARQTVVTIEAGYNQGRFTVLEILDAYRVVADAELMEHEALASFHSAVATIEGLTATPINNTRARQ